VCVEGGGPASCAHAGRNRVIIIVIYGFVFVVLLLFILIYCIVMVFIVDYCCSFVLLFIFIVDHNFVVFVTIL
jgi:hypothetical protein